MDLSDLIESYGSETIAEVLGVTERTLINLRLGHVALTVDDLYELERRFVSFDTVETVRSLGESRALKKTNRKSRKKEIIHA